MILVLTAHEDAHVHAVMRELARFSGPAVRLVNLTETAGGLEIEDLDRLTSVWWRPPQRCNSPHRLLDPERCECSISEPATAFNRLQESTGALWVNGVLRNAAASFRPWQYAVAEQCDFPLVQRQRSHDRHIRVIAVGARFFAAEATGDGYREHRLPGEIHARLLCFMQRIGLEYATFDLRISAGEYRFQEAQPSGAFLYVQMATGMPIAFALAEHLACGQPAFASN